MCYRAHAHGLHSAGSSANDKTIKINPNRLDYSESKPHLRPSVGVSSELPPAHPGLRGAGGLPVHHVDAKSEKKRQNGEKGQDSYHMAHNYVLFSSIFFPSTSTLL